jgi:hypothetical protein
LSFSNTVRHPLSWNIKLIAAVREHPFAAARRLGGIAAGIKELRPDLRPPSEAAVPQV